MIKLIFLSLLCFSGFLQMEPVTKRFGSGDFYSEVMNYNSQPYTQSSFRSTNAHETAHGIHAKLRNDKMRETAFKENISGFFLGGGRYIYFFEPNIKLSSVSGYLPESLKGRRHNLYLRDQTRHFNTRPLYILDEYVCYLLGAKVCVDDLENNRFNNNHGHDGVAGCFEFSIYSIALVKAIEDQDPEYFEREPRFLDFIKYLIAESHNTFNKGIRYKQMYSATQNHLFYKLKTADDAQDFRDFLIENCGSAFLKIENYP
jgi:hypothetical protein